MKKIALVVAALATFVSSNAFAMCGCFVAPPPKVTVASKLSNKSSRVVMVHDGDRTVVTMSNDYKGDPTDFAIVIPVPTAITREQIHVGDTKMLDTLANATAPRLLEYPGWDPCRPMPPSLAGAARDAEGAPGAGRGAGGAAKSLGVTVDAKYTVGEYDIQMLSATDSDGLVTWLKQNGYQVPEGAGQVFQSYLRQEMRFFVAKVNLKEQSKLGYAYLRPIQIAYESSKFVLPIRLGMLNADGDQELLVWAITKSGRVESTNYRNVKVPLNQGNLPGYVAGEFDRVYQSIFRNLEKREGNDVVFEEYAGSTAQTAIAPRWPGAPVVAAPSAIVDDGTLRDLGAWWHGSAPSFVTRMHFTYDREHFPEDLVLQVTSDSAPYQAQFTVQDRPTPSCYKGDQLRQWEAQMEPAKEQEAQTLARLTGWDASDIRARMNRTGNDSGTKGDGKTDSKKNDAWYHNLWK